MLRDALIGHTGFVGSSLLRQRYFQSQYSSATIGDIKGRRFDTVVCCAAPAQKWLANTDPYADLQKIMALIDDLQSFTCENFVLVSTVDVFREPIAVDEDLPPDETGLEPYGLHRRLLEKFVEKRFSRHLIVRLPGLVGPGLRKNVVFDLLNSNNLRAIDSRAMFQFYPMVNLWRDIAVGVDNQLSLLHLTAEPISVSEVAAEGFGVAFDQELLAAPVVYDFQSRYGGLFGGAARYQYSRRESLLAIRAYAQSEPRLVRDVGA